MSRPFDGWMLLLLAGIVLTFLLLAWAVWKIRKIHLATYELTFGIAATRRETEALFWQLQALMALERKLGLSEPLPALRGWAGSPDFLLAVADQTVSRRPRTVVECSSGASTVVIARCLQLNGFGHLFSLEHDPLFAAKTRCLLQKYALAEWATVIDSPLQTITTETPWYSEAALPANLSPIDMLIVDGPPASIASFARAPAFPRLRPRLASQFIVILDDADRPDEVETVRRWQALEPRLNLTRAFSEKGLAILEFGA